VIKYASQYSQKNGLIFQSFTEILETELRGNFFYELCVWQKTEIEKGEVLSSPFLIVKTKGFLPPKDPHSLIQL